MWYTYSTTNTIIGCWEKVNT